MSSAMYRITFSDPGTGVGGMVVMYQCLKCSKKDFFFKVIIQNSDFEPMYT